MFATILAVVLCVICIGIAVYTTLHDVKMSRLHGSLLEERSVLSEKLDVLEGLMKPGGSKPTPEAKLILARNYLRGLRVWARV